MVFTIHKSAVATLAFLTILPCASLAETVIPFDFDFGTGNGTLIDPAPSSFGNHYSDNSFIDGYPYASEFEFVDDGVTVNIEAGVVRPISWYNGNSSSDTFQGGDQGVYVGQFSGGLGVGYETQPGNIDDDYHHVEDLRGRDFLVLQFNQEVWLETLDFDYFGPVNWHQGISYADVQIYADSIDGELLFTGRIPFGEGVITFSGLGLQGDRFIVAPKWDGWENEGMKNDWFKLRGATGHAVVPTPTAVVGSLAMLGLLGGGLGRRRRD